MKLRNWVGFASVLFFSLGLEAQAGTINGTVKFSGTPPAPKMMEITKDPEACGKGSIPSDELVVNKANGGVQYAVASIKDIKTDKKATAGAAPVLVQKKCVFSPHVLVIPANVEFEIHNNDPVAHNIHTYGLENATINRGQPKTVPVIKHKFEFAERIKVQCDIHKWMKAWFIVADQPYTAVSDGNGSFQIKDVPPGTYQLQVWHESLGGETKPVTVKGDEVVPVTFELKEKKK